MMYGSEYRTKREREKALLGFGYAIPDGPSKAQLRNQLAEAVRNTAEMQRRAVEVRARTARTTLAAR